MKVTVKTLKGEIIDI